MLGKRVGCRHRGHAAAAGRAWGLALAGRQWSPSACGAHVDHSERRRAGHSGHRQPHAHGLGRRGAAAVGGRGFGAGARAVHDDRHAIDPARTACPRDEPSLLILVAPFEVGFAAYVNLTGRVDLSAGPLFYFGVFLLVVLGPKVFKRSVPVDGSDGAGVFDGRLLGN